ncbi:MAG: DUF3307 domain-containing protein [Pseudomonadota bacterium]|nr:DUF3307 domain-containing protein [Pseudomonadota bacterium]
MIETLIALVAAHVLADYVFQSTKVAANKHRIGYLAIHGFIVFGTAALLTGSFTTPIYVLTALHITTDFFKASYERNALNRNKPKINAHVADQLIHIGTLTAVAYFAPTLWGTGLWAQSPDWLPHLLLLLAGAIYATRAGGFAVGILMHSYGSEFSKDSLPGGGQMIGFLERGLIYILILAGLPIGIGFLVAAKSVLRFETAKEGDAHENRRRSEYVIIGTLASFGWAILVSLAILFLFAQLPDLGIPMPSP